MRTPKFFVFALLSAFFICGEYAMTRPVSNALFLSYFSAKGFPLVWLVTMPINLAVIYGYTKLLPKIGPLKIFLSLAAVTCAVNGATAIFCKAVPMLVFFQFAWKDIYVLLMLKQLWSMVHSTIDKDKAKKLYGIIYGTGTVGAICGSLVPTFFSVALGAENLLLMTLPGYLLLAIFYRMALKSSALSLYEFPTQNPAPKEALSLLRTTPMLMGVLSLVVCMQVSVGLMEYQFNSALEHQILDQNNRAAYSGKLTSLINCLSLFLQFAGSYFFVQTLGLAQSHLAIPVILCVSTMTAIAFGSFEALSISYIVLKAVDFSLFNVLREMLYIPMSLDAKFRAKAIVDVFAYRTSKGLLSLALIALQFVAGVYLPFWIQILSFAIFLSWILAALFLFRTKTVSTV